MKDQENTLVVLAEVQYPDTVDELKAYVEEFKDAHFIDMNAEDAGEQYQAVVKGQSRGRKHRTSIEKTRKTLKEPAFEYGKRVDAIAKELTAIVEPTERKLIDIRKAVEDHEQRIQDEAIEAERNRVDTIEQGISNYREYLISNINSDSTQLKKIIDMFEEHPATEEQFQERFEEAKAVYTQVFQDLNGMYATKIMAENAEKLQKEQEEEAKAEKAKRDAEHEAERESLKKEREELNREKLEMQREKDAKAEAERAKLAEAEEEALRVEQEQERLERSKQSLREEKDKLQSAEDAIQRIIDGTEMYARDIVTAIADGDIPYVSWDVQYVSR